MKRRRRGPSALTPWVPVALCLGLAGLPAGPRRALRDRLLDLHGRLARAAGAGDPRAETDSAAENRARILEAENARLKRDLLLAGAAPALATAGPKARWVPAEAMPLGAGRELQHRAVLGRGRQDGVLEGHPVLAGDALVGLVAAATPSTCEVRLVTDPGFRLRATIARAGGEVEGLLRGDGSDTLTFQPAILDPAAPAPVPQVGETVFSSRASLLCGVPAVLGVVVAVERVPGSTVPQARVRPTVDLGRLGAVLIVVPGDPS